MNFWRTRPASFLVIAARLLFVSLLFVFDAFRPGSWAAAGALRDLHMSVALLRGVEAAACDPAPAGARRPRSETSLGGDGVRNRDARK